MPQQIVVPTQELTKQAPPAPSRITVPTAKLGPTLDQGPPKPSAGPAPTPQAPPPYALPKDLTELYTRAGQRTEEERQAIEKQREYTTETQQLNVEEARRKAKFGQEVADAYKAYSDNPTPENLQRVRLAESIYTGKLEPREPIYRPTKQESIWRATVGIPDDIPLDKLTPEQMRNRQMAIMQTVNEDARKQRLAEEHLRTIISESNERLKNSPTERAEVNRRADALKTRLRVVGQKIAALQNINTQATIEPNKDKRAEDIAVLEKEQDNILDDIDKLQSGPAPSGDSGDWQSYAKKHKLTPP